MTKPQIFFLAYFTIGVIAALFTLRSAHKYSLKLIFIRAFVAFIAWPFLLTESY